jgi:plastocyanin
MFEAILRGLHQPEYVHVLLNPLPVYGLAVSLIGLFVAICVRSRAATVVALVMVFISATAAWPVYEYGEQAYDRVLSMTDNNGQAWLASHKERAEDLIWLFYALAILSAIALIAPVKRPGLSIWLAVAVLSLGAITLGSGEYIAYAGGRIRHHEFRNEPPPKGMGEAPAGAVTPAAQPAGSVAPAAVKVSIKSLKYSPNTIQITKGETVEWVNDDLTPHTVTSNSGGEFDSGSMDVGATWRHTFTQPGTFAYSCRFHREMKGSIVVK